MESIYSCIFSTQGSACSFRYKSFVCMATAWPMKSIVFGSNLNFFIISSEVPFFGSNFLYVFKSFSSNLCINVKNFLHLRFSNSPIRSLFRASESFAGTYYVYIYIYIYFAYFCSLFG